MRVKVVPRADKPLIAILGMKAPTTPLPKAPPGLSALVKQAGEGLLAGEVWLFGVGPRHDDAMTRLTARLGETQDTVAWLPLRRTDRSTWTLVGELVGGRGWLVWDSLLGTLRCFVATGEWRTVGADLPDVLKFLAARVLLELLLGVRVEPLEEERTRVTPVNYAVGLELPGTSFADALRRCVDAQPSFSALLEQLPWPDGALVAREVLQRHPSAEWSEHVALVVKRSELCSRLVAALEKPWAPWLAEQRAAGFIGTGAVDDATLARTESSSLRNAAAWLANATHQVPAFFTRLFALSPLEAIVAQVDAESFSRTWPLAVLTGDLRAMRALNDEAFVAALDAWLEHTNGLDAAALAPLRMSSAGLSDAHLARLMAEAATPECRAGVLALLATQARRPGVMELFRDLAQRGDGDVNPILDAATVCGKRDVALEALRLVYSRPRAWDEYCREDAARVAARLGDAHAQELVQRREATLARRSRDM